MSIATRSPLRMVGGNVNSGNVNTGELMTIRGGSQHGCIYSGTINAGGNGVVGFGIQNASGGHVQLWSGPGRLNTVQPHVQLQSGVAVFFYDAGAITLSGISTSGFPILGTIPATYPGGYLIGAAGVGFQPSVAFAGQPFNVDIPFSSGLCAAIPSGSPGFTCSWTPETNPLFG